MFPPFILMIFWTNRPFLNHHSFNAATFLHSSNISFMYLIYFLSAMAMQAGTPATPLSPQVVGLLSCELAITRIQYLI
jgi:hypothetical protein